MLTLGCVHPTHSSAQMQCMLAGPMVALAHMSLGLVACITAAVHHGLTGIPRQADERCDIHALSGHHGIECAILHVLAEAQAHTPRNPGESGGRPAIADGPPWHVVGCGCSCSFCSNEPSNWATAWTVLRAG
jgi:hypothetical protein